MLLLINKHGIALLEVVNLKIEAMNVTFELSNIRLSSDNPATTVISLLAPDSQLFIEASSPINQSATFLLEDLNA